jgi:hypothetical protein
MIRIKISGGLGNQLFQYAFGQYAAKKLNTEVLYHAQTKLVHKNFTKRELDIEKFNLPINFTEENFDEKSFFHSDNLSRYERKLSQIFPFINKKINIQSPDIHKLVENIKDNCYYEGYWQNSMYPDSISELLKSKIVLSDTSFAKLKYLITEIENSDSISIHIRRGDYMNIAANAKIYNICDMDYYEKAMDFIGKKTSNPRFFIFTEDIDWAKENFVGDKFRFVTGNSAIEDMILMSMCKNQIIANSTFSWWAAWLNKNNQKIVTAPQKWYVNFLQNQLNDFLPKNWIKL